MGSHSLRPPAAERSAQRSESPAKANHLAITAGVLNEEAGGAVSQREECERQAWQLSRGERLQPPWKVSQRKALGTVPRSLQDSLEALSLASFYKQPILCCRPRPNA